MNKYRDYLRNTLLMTVLTVGLFFVMPQSRVLAEEGEENKQEQTQEDANLNVSNQTDQLPGGTVSLLATSADPAVVGENQTTPEGEQQTSGEVQGTENPSSTEGNSNSGTPADTSAGSDAASSSGGGETQENGTSSGESQITGGEAATDTGSSDSSGNTSQQDLNRDSQTQSGEATDGSTSIDPAPKEGTETPAGTEITPDVEGEEARETAIESLTEDDQNKLSVSAIPASVSNDETVVEAIPDKSSDNTYIEGVTYMSSRVYDYDIPVRFQYSDQYFDRDSLNGGYDTDLATLSAIAAGTTSGSNRAKGYVYDPETDSYKIVEDVDFPERFENQSKNVQEFLRQIGFSNIAVNPSYKIMGTPISAGVALGMKKITDSDGKEYTLISVLPRSTSYFGEWANSMEIGGNEDEDYQGISQAVNDDILAFLTTYLQENNVQGDVKIWAAGLSRGGALVNLTAAYLDQQLENGKTNKLLGLAGINLSAKDIYAYTFGAPYAASIANAKLEDGTPNPIYHNIHNFVATYDVVVGALQGKWPTTRYGYDQDVVKDTDECLKNLDTLMDFYAVTNNKSREELTSSDYYMYVDENNKPHYSPVEYVAKYGSYDGMNLETFIQSYMKGITETFPREKFAEEIQPALMFFGETYYGYPTEIKQKLTKEALLDAAKQKGTEVAMEALIDVLSGDIKALNELLKYVLNPTQILPDVLLDTFDNIGMYPVWDLDNHVQFTEEQIASGEARKINRGYVVDFVKGLVKFGISDPIGFYNLYRAYGTMWASHELDVDLSWLHLSDTEENQEYYLTPVTEGESWGYRMVTLPKSDDMLVLVYEGYENVSIVDLKAGIVGNHFLHAGPVSDYYIRMNFDSEGNKILYLRADREYTISFMPAKEVTTEGMKLVEYEFMENRFIDQPGVVLYTDDFGVNLGELSLVYVGEREKEAVYDRLLYNIGKIPFGEENENGVVLLRSVTAEKPKHNAEKYSLTKLIQLGAQASIGGAVSDATSVFFRSSNLEETKSASLTATTAAGYRFLGWYLNGKLISTDPTIVRTYQFLSHSELLTARFELIPVPPKPDPKPDPKPTPGGGGSSSSAIVEVAAVTNGQITQNVKTAKRNKTPNTGDTDNAIWLFWMVLGLAGVAGSAYLLKED